MQRRDRPDAFLFPSDTVLRFVLLVLGIIAVTGYVAYWLYLSVPPFAKALARDYGACLDALPATPSIEGARRLGDCRAEANAPMLVWISGATVVLLGVAFVDSQLSTRRKLKRGGFRDLGPDHPAAVRVGRLASDLGLARGPRVVWNPRNAVPTAVAFGRLGRPHVGISGRLAVDATTDEARFEAIVLHELGHVVNRDVTQTYLTISLMRTFAVFLLVPFALSLVRTELAVAVGFVWRVAVLSAAVALVGLSVLRARELYADARALSWSDGSETIKRILSTDAERPRRWRSILSFHPTGAERARALDDSTPLFRLGFLDATGVGMIVMVTAGLAITLVGLFVDPLVAHRAGGAVLGALVVGIGGLALWRETFALQAAQGRTPSAARVGLGLAVGMLIGQRLSPDAAVMSSSAGVPLSESPVIPFVLWAAAVTATTLFLSRWVIANASTWLRSRTAVRRPTIRALAVLVACGGIAALWFGELLSLYAYGVFLLQGDLFGTGLSDYLDTFGLVDFASPLRDVFPWLSLWLLPLIPAVAGRRRLSRGRSEGDAEDYERPGRTLLFVLVTCVLASALVGAVLMGLQPRLFATSDQAMSNLEKAQLLVVAGGALAAGIVASRSSEIGDVYGLLASTVVGVLGSIATFFAVDEFVQDFPKFFWFTFGPVLAWGSVAAVVTTAVVRSVRALLATHFGRGVSTDVARVDL